MAASVCDSAGILVDNLLRYYSAKKKFNMAFCVCVLAAYLLNSNTATTGNVDPFYILGKHLLLPENRIRDRFL
jgi:hypothetical protein